MTAWLVRITVNPGCTRLFTRGLLDGHEWHRDLMRLLPDHAGSDVRREHGLLFRVEPGAQTVLTQLTTPPRIQALAEDFAQQTQQRRLDPFLDCLETGMRVRYRIAANPTKRHGNTAEADKRGKLQVLRAADAEQWWLRRAGEAGLRPLRVQATPLDDILGGPVRTEKGKAETKRKRPARHGITRFDGTAEVTDPDLVRQAVLTGIGRARSYGCGLLSLGPDRRTP